MAEFEYPKDPKIYSDFDFSSYKSPIARAVDEVFNDVVKRDNDYLMAQVRIAVGYDINKDKLIKALQYDRHQYEVGYADGKFARDREIIRCRECKHYSPKGLVQAYCGKEFADEFIKPELSPDDFCSRGERREK